MLFSRWGRFVYRFRRPVALIALLVGVGSLAFASRTAGELSSGGWLDKSAESSTVADRLASEFGAGRSNLIVLFRGAGVDAASPDFQAGVATALATVATDPRVSGIVGSAGVWPQAIRFLASGVVDPTPIVTARYPLDDAPAALAAASLGSGNIKVHIEAPA